MTFPGSIRSAEPAPFKGKIGEIDNWLRHLKWYFKTTNVDYKDEEADRAISLCLTLFRGTALEWAKRQETENPIVLDSWDNFETALRRSFGVLDSVRRAREQYKVIRQKSSVDVYV